MHQSYMFYRLSEKVCPLLSRKKKKEPLHNFPLSCPLRQRRLHCENKSKREPQPPRHAPAVQSTNKLPIFCQKPSTPGLFTPTHRLNTQFFQGFISHLRNKPLMSDHILNPIKNKSEKSKTL